MESWNTYDRCYAYDDYMFTKRTLLPHERIEDINGKTIVLPWTRERLRNEYLALKFVSENTTIPVPKILNYEETTELVSLTIERVQGYQLESARIPNREQAVAHVQEYIHSVILPQLRRLRRPYMGSLDGPIILSTRLGEDVHKAQWRPSRAGDYSFCHGDLAQHNILVDRTTFKVLAVLDWEYSGFDGPEFELPLWSQSSGEDGHYEIGAESVPRLVRRLQGKVAGEGDDVVLPANPPPRMLYFIGPKARESGLCVERLRRWQIDCHRMGSDDIGGDCLHGGHGFFDVIERLTLWYCAIVLRHSPVVDCFVYE